MIIITLLTCFIAAVNARDKARHFKVSHWGDPLWIFIHGGMYYLVDCNLITLVSFLSEQWN